jgi:hypothetical protein
MMPIIPHLPRSPYAHLSSSFLSSSPPPQAGVPINGPQSQPLTAFATEGFLRGTIISLIFTLVIKGELKVTTTKAGELDYILKPLIGPAVAGGGGGSLASSIPQALTRFILSPARALTTQSIKGGLLLSSISYLNGGLEKLRGVRDPLNFFGSMLGVGTFMGYCMLRGGGSGGISTAKELWRAYTTGGAKTPLPSVVKMMKGGATTGGQKPLTPTFKKGNRNRRHKGR